MKEQEDTVTVHQWDVACDGGISGHPRVFLHIDRDTKRITCPYCSRTFALAGGGHAQDAA